MGSMYDELKESMDVPDTDYVVPTPLMVKRFMVFAWDNRVVPSYGWENYKASFDTMQKVRMFNPSSHWKEGHIVDLHEGTIIEQWYGSSRKHYSIHYDD